MIFNPSHKTNYGISFLQASACDYTSTECKSVFTIHNGKNASKINLYNNQAAHNWAGFIYQNTSTVNNRIINYKDTQTNHIHRKIRSKWSLARLGQDRTGIMYEVYLKSKKKQCTEKTENNGAWTSPQFIESDDDDDALNARAGSTLWRFFVRTSVFAVMSVSLSRCTPKAKVNATDLPIRWRSEEDGGRMQNASTERARSQRRCRSNLQFKL